MARHLPACAAALTVIVLTLFSLAVQADARIAWLGVRGGPLTIAADDGVGGRVVVAPAVTGFELAPRGDAVAYDDDRGVAWLRVFAEAAPVRLPAGAVAGGGRAAWSRDGRELALARDVPGRGAQLLVVDRRGHAVDRVALGASRKAEGVAWGPGTGARKRMAFVRTGVDARHPSQVVLLARDGRGAREIRTAGRDHPLAYGPVWTSDGIALMVGAPTFSPGDFEGAHYALALVDGHGQPRALGEDTGLPRTASLNPGRFALAGAACVWDVVEDTCVRRALLADATVMDVSASGASALVVRDGRLEAVALEDGVAPAAVAVAGPIADAQWSVG